MHERLAYRRRCVVDEGEGYWRWTQKWLKRERLIALIACPWHSVALNLRRNDILQLVVRLHIFARLMHVLCSSWRIKRRTVEIMPLLNIREIAILLMRCPALLVLVAFVHGASFSNINRSLIRFIDYGGWCSELSPCFGTHVTRWSWQLVL